MIGILCSEGKLQSYSRNFFYFLHDLLNNEDKKVVVFTASGVNLPNNTVKGNLITKDSIDYNDFEIPTIIYNFSYQIKKKYMRIIRSLSQIDRICIVNEVNYFSQHMIMEILSSCEDTKDALLNLSQNKISNKDNFKEKKCVLLLPKRGINNSKKIMLKKTIEKENKNNPTYNILKNEKKLLILDAPNLLLNKNNPILATLYLQRGSEGKWVVVNRLNLPQNIVKTDGLLEKLSAKAIKAISYVSCFIPSLGFGSVDFVLEENLTPYFINLRGWNPSFLMTYSNNDIKNSFAKNLLDYGSFLSEKHKGGVDFVD